MKRISEITTQGLTTTKELKPYVLPSEEDNSNTIVQRQRRRVTMNDRENFIDLLYSVFKVKSVRIIFWNLNL